MLDEMYLQILDMSKTASAVIILVLAARLLLRRAPKIFSYALWAVVLLRLLCPVSMESPVSLVPRVEPTVQDYALLDEPISAAGAAEAAYRAVGDLLNGGIGIQHVRTTEPQESGASTRIISTDWRTVWLLFGQYVWITGASVMLACSFVSYIKIRRKLRVTVPLRDNIRIADDITSPFVIGLFRPKIYLPCSLSEEEQKYILLHEQHHIRRGDHIVKALAFAALCIHWFNPLVWLAFVLACRDMEMSCDEAVIRSLGEDIRAEYSASLLTLATGRRIIGGTPLAFGEGDPGARIRNLAKWRKPAAGVILYAVIVCGAAAVCLLGERTSEEAILFGAGYSDPVTLYTTAEEYRLTYDEFVFFLASDGTLHRGMREDGAWTPIGKMEPYTLSENELEEYTAYTAGWRRKYRLGTITESYILRLPGGVSGGNDFYLLFRTSRGDTLLGFGWEDVNERWSGLSDDTSLFWLYRIKPAAGYIHRVGKFSSAYPFDSVSVFGMAVPDEAKTELISLLDSHTKTRFPVGLDDPGPLSMSVEIHCLDGSFYMLHHQYYSGFSFTRGREDPYRSILTWYSGDGDHRAWRIEEDFDGAFREWYDSVIPRFADAIHIDTTLRMMPTDADIDGVFDNYLYLTRDGMKYRYEEAGLGTALQADGLTRGELLASFTESAFDSRTEWKIYAVKEYPSLHCVIAVPDTGEASLYVYSPAKAVDPERLAEVIASGMVMMEDGDVTSGQEIWQSFCEKTQRGKTAAVQVAQYYTLDPEKCDETYYEAYKEDYPSLYVQELTYDGALYTLRWTEQDTQYVRHYRYLMKYEGTIASYQSSKSPRDYTRYVLTNDNTVSWDDIMRGMASSRLSDYIDHFSIYTDIE